MKLRHLSRFASLNTLLVGATLALALAFLTATPATSAERPPNIVVIFLDDAGWADFEPFGIPPYQTPHVRQLASEGCRFNQFYVPQAICSASRAAFLSGCYPGRTKVFGAHGPNGRGLDPKFANIAEMLNKVDYQTAVFGKWHVGDQPETRPAARGFDESAGLMYSNDMWEFHPENPEHWGKFPLQYYENNRVTIGRVTKEHQPFLTTWYTEKAVDFIKRHRSEPFFLYVPHSMPHVPLFVSEKFAGKSGSGLYGDVMMEIDWSVGQINQALKNHGLGDDTLLLFTSDNGPWISYGNHAGATPFREAKGTSFDGGIRSACIAKFPGRIPAGAASRQAWSTIDLLPTIAHLADAPLPDNPIDGKNVWPIVSQAPRAENPHRYYPFSNGNQFQGILSGDGKWKLHLPHRYRTLVRPANDGNAGKYRQAQIEISLFDLEHDPYETTNVAAKHPEIFRELKSLAESHRERFYGGAN